jgi:hypothetical protein
LAVLGAVVFLWNAAFDRDPAHARRSGTPAGKDEPIERLPPAAELSVENGVAAAPDFEAPEAKRGELVWYGQVVDAATRAAVPRASVVLERMNDRKQWAQRPTRDGGYFVARIKTEPSGETWRLVVETTDGMLGIKPLLAATVPTDVGRVLLYGQAKLLGFAFYSRHVPAEDVQLWLRRFGELVPGAAWIDVAKSDEKGHFEFEKLPHGMYVVEGLGPRGHRFLAAPVYVPSPVPRRIGPLPSGPYRYRVVNSLGEPVRDAALRLTPTGSPEPLGRDAIMSPFTSVSDTDGDGAIEQLPWGRYAIEMRVRSVTYEFTLDHTAKPARRDETHVYRVATDDGVAIRFVQKPVTDPPVPMAKEKIRTEGHFKVNVTTDALGIAYVPIKNRRGLELRATTAERFGGAVLPASRLREGRSPFPLAMEFLGRERGEGPLTRRVVRVQTPLGEPVEGALVYIVGKNRVKTNRDGVAEVGDALDAGAVRLYRPDLASGDPEIGPLGRVREFLFTWQAGRPLRVHVVDAEEDFPLSRRVRIEPRPRAWKLAEPGLFETRWDGESGGELVVSAPGYRTWREDMGSETDYAAGLERYEAATATLRIEVRHDRAQARGVWVSGRIAADDDVPGRASFRALTGPTGQVVVESLRPGACGLFADGAGLGSATANLVLAKGDNPIVLHLKNGPTIRGIVVTGKNRRRLRHVLVRGMDGSDIRPVRTDYRGAFRIHLPVFDGKTYLFVASLDGYGDEPFQVVAKARDKPIAVLLGANSAFHIGLKWQDVRSDPIPGDIEMRIDGIDRIVSVRGGHLFADNLPVGRRLWLRQVRGSAWVPDFSVQLQRGKLQRGAAQVYSGGIAEGLVVRKKQPVPNAVVYFEGPGGIVRVARTNERGEFRRLGLPPGPYNLNARDQTGKSIERNRGVIVHDRRVVPDLVVEVE